MSMGTQCIRCKHFLLSTQFNCDAFPERIPHEIFVGKVSHKKPYPGDHGIQFEPIEESKPRNFLSTWDPPKDMRHITLEFKWGTLYNTD